MGPTNEALVTLYDADRAYNAAQAKLDAATRDVRLQQRRVDTATQRKATADTASREAKANSDRLSLDLKARDEHIEKLRGQQQTARNNKEYQALLMEITTSKVDREKIEEQAIAAMETVETSSAERSTAGVGVEQENARHGELSADIGDRAVVLQAEVDALRPARDEARQGVPAAILSVYERLAERYDGDAMAPVERPDDRKEMYVCGECNVEQRVDVFYRLHSRDEVIACDNCRRLLYLPPGMTPEAAVNKKKPAPKKRVAKAKDSPDATGGDSVATSQKPPLPPPTVAKSRKNNAPEPWRDLLDEAAVDSLSIAQADASGSVECGVLIDGTLAGFYRGKSADHLERTIRRKAESRGVTGDLKVHRRDTLEAGAADSSDSLAAADQTS